MTLRDDLVRSAMVNAEESADRKIGARTRFEFFVTLIQQELNHERSKSTRTGFFEQRRPTSQAEERNSEEIPDRSGAAVRPRSGIQRVPELASFLTA